MIFDQLLAEKLIQLYFGHILPKAEDVRGKTFCKYHNSWKHTTNNCVIFRDMIQDLIDAGTLKFPEAKPAMKVDTNPFPEAQMNMVYVRFPKDGSGPKDSTGPCKAADESQLSARSTAEGVTIGNVRLDPPKIAVLCTRCQKEVLLDRVLKLQQPDEEGKKPIPARVVTADMEEGEPNKVEASHGVWQPKKESRGKGIAPAKVKTAETREHVSGSQVLSKRPLTPDTSNKRETHDPRRSVGGVFYRLDRPNGRSFERAPIRRRLNFDRPFYDEEYHRRNERENKRYPRGEGCSRDSYDNNGNPRPLRTYKPPLVSDNR